MRSSACLLSRLDQDLDRFPVVHRAVAVRYVVEAHDPIEDSTRSDPAVEDIRQQLLDVRADRGGSAAHGDVVVERRPRRGHRLAWGNTTAPTAPPRTAVLGGGRIGLLRAAPSG